MSLRCSCAPCLPCPILLQGFDQESTNSILRVVEVILLCIGSKDNCLHTEYSVNDKSKLGVKYYPSTEMELLHALVICVKSRIAKDSERAALQETLDAVASRRFGLNGRVGLGACQDHSFKVSRYSDSREYAL